MYLSTSPTNERNNEMYALIWHLDEYNYDFSYNYNYELVRRYCKIFWTKQNETKRIEEKRNEQKGNVTKINMKIE